jgi:hypothetical protein
VSIGCATTVVLNIILGLFAGHLAGGIAVAGASAFSLACGYCIIVVAYQLQNHASFLQLFPKESFAVAFTSVAGAMICLPFFRVLRVRSIFPVDIAAITAAVLITIVLIPVWTHPMRKRVFQLVFSRVST